MALAGGAFALMLAWFAAPEVAFAQCCAPPAPPPCCAPPPPCCQPPSPPPVSPPCCTPGHNINIPGINVFVGASVVVNAQVNAQASAQANAQGGGFVFFGGGGGGGGGYAPPSPMGVIQGLNVEGGQAMRRISYEATRTRVRRVVIQAFCFDDLNVPHPASQVTPDRDIAEMYDGELYRCIAGTHMQVTIAEYSGQINFTGGETITCAKGQSLFHVPHAGQGEGDDRAWGARLECRAQRPARDCNERSLLRRYGAGVKILTMIRVEHYTAWREERVETSSSSSMTFSMDGGVGGINY